MPQLKLLADGSLIDVPGEPRWFEGHWVCGDVRYADPTRELFTAAGYPTLSPMAFYLAFTPAERIAIKASADPTVKEFWSTYELAVQLGSNVDPNLVSVQAGLDALTAQNLIAAGRKAQILAGVPQ